MRCCTAGSVSWLTPSRIQLYTGASPGILMIELCPRSFRCKFNFYRPRLWTSFDPMCRKSKQQRALSAHFLFLDRPPIALLSYAVVFDPWVLIRGNRFRGATVRGPTWKKSWSRHGTFGFGDASVSEITGVITLEAWRCSSWIGSDAIASASWSEV